MFLILVSVKDDIVDMLDPVINFLSVYGIRPDMQNGTCRGTMHRALTIIPSQSNGPKPSCKGTMHRAPTPAPIFTGECSKIVTHERQRDQSA